MEVDFMREQAVPAKRTLCVGKSSFPPIRAIARFFPPQIPKAMGMMGFWITHPKAKHPLIDEVDRDFVFLLNADNKH